MNSKCATIAPLLLSPRPDASDNNYLETCRMPEAKLLLPMMLRHPNLKVLKVHKTIYIYTLYRIRAVLHSSLDPLDQFLFDVPVNLLFLWSVPSLVRLAGGNLSQEKVPFRKKRKKKKNQRAVSLCS